MTRQLLIAWLAALLLTACARLPLPNRPQTLPTLPPATSLPTFAPPTAAPKPTTTPPSVTPTASPTPRTDLPDPSGYTWVQVVSGLERPVRLAVASDGDPRLFVLEQAGLIRIVQNGALLPTPFLDIRDRVGSQGFEQGLLGLAFHPQYAQNGYFFVNYTDRNGDTVIARFRVSADPNRADPATEEVLLRISQPYSNHNGGHLTFGPDGMLYIGTGDGGAAGDPHGNAQSLDTLLGKLLRIDVNHGQPYAVPADNPFVNRGGRPEIWAYGLRNPWTFTFDRLTGDLFIADVGQDKWEEIDFLPADTPGGANFGWDYREGAHPFEGEPPASPTLIDPVAEYGHDLGCSVTGGEVYRGPMTTWQGVYFYGDYCSGNIWGLLRLPDDSWKTTLLFQRNFRITAFGADVEGNMYLLSHDGELYLFTKAGD